MVQESSFISSFRKLPAACIVSIVLVAAVLIVCYKIYWNDAIIDNEYKLKLEEMRRTSTDLLILGDSQLSQMNISEINNAINLSEAKNGRIIYLSGGVARTYTFMLDACSYKCINKNGLFILAITPMALNKNNAALKKTIGELFTLKEFFSEVIFMSWEDMGYYLKYNLLNLGSYKKALLNAFEQALSLNKDNTKMRLPVQDIGMLRNEFDIKLLNMAIERYKNEFFRNYTIDYKQVEHINSMIKKLESRNVTTVIVMMPQSKELRNALGNENLDNFMKAVESINAIKLDYVTNYSGEEYSYFDGVHFTAEEGNEFSDTFGRDLKEALLNR